VTTKNKKGEIAASKLGCILGSPDSKQRKYVFRCFSFRYYYACRFSILNPLNNLLDLYTRISLDYQLNSRIQSADLAGFDLIYPPSNNSVFLYQWMVLQELNIAFHGAFDLRERLKVNAVDKGHNLSIGVLLLQFAAKDVVSEEQHATSCVVEHGDLVGSEELLGNDNATDTVLAKVACGSGSAPPTSFG
jgi:hypothetical protein